MKFCVVILYIVLFTSCASQGYNPHYIVTDSLDEEPSSPTSSLGLPSSY